MGARLLPRVLAYLLGLVILSTLAYIKIIYGATFSWNAIVDGLYFSVQTVTTVGYGDWKPLNMTLQDSQVFWMKVVCIPTMIGGASLFAIAIGAAVQWLGE